MTESVITWLQSASWRDLLLVFLLENFAIFAIVIILGGWIATLLRSRRVALPAETLTYTEVAVALLNVLLNTATTLIGLWLWRKGIIHFRTDTGLLAIADILILLFVMDLLMYALHRLAHTRALYSLLHKFHHRFENPRPLTLFALSPVENLAFGSLWLAVISIYHASWLGMSIYLALNVLFGAVGHLGVEPFPARWVKTPILRNLAGGSFHAQHHQEMGHNFGFYTLIWDRIFGTIRPSYEQDYGHVPALAKE